ncbi:M20 family metallopeptidase [Clostridium sp.]|uniref:M20 family metallopeptidase n=1 Tax=Clostridium sp. TaxID=1506 RepID=UPI001A497BE3|nr:M20 family metallopeptidase [Clostridium sp.]MBK5234517.1 M20 family metallopeptidase [Clostridium sp.]
MNFKNFITGDEIISIAKQLVSMESHKNYELKESEVAIWIKNYLEKEGIESSIEDVEKNRPNVYGQLRGENEGIELMLTGHTDTVLGFNMDYPPFQPFIKDGKLYGRGSVDMKGGITAMLAAMVAVKRSNAVLSHGVMFAGVIDEEERSKGTEYLIKKNVKAKMAIIGEPTQLKVCTAHKGMEWIEVTFKGRSAHASRPHEGINAIYAATEFIKMVKDELQPKIESYKFDILGNGSINVGVIQGGDEPNIVCDQCSLKIDRRWLPNETMESLYDEITKVAQKAIDIVGGTFEIRRMSEYTSALGNSPHHIQHNHPLVQQAIKSVTEVTGKPQEPCAFPAWSDAALLSTHMGTECIILGPGNINQAHSNDEFCEIDQIIQATYIYMDIIEKLCVKEIK